MHVVFSLILLVGLLFSGCWENKDQIKTDKKTEEPRGRE